MSTINLTTNVPSIEWDQNGVKIPEENEVLTGVIQDFQNAFGTDLAVFNQSDQFLLSTPQGQLITSIAAIISDRNRLLAYYVNQVDPNYAIGRMQDGIGRIYFIERRKATNTKVVGVCYGGVSVVIPKGTQVQDGNGYIYTADADYTIGDNGTVNATFICNEEGAIECPVNSLQMYQIIAGWDNVNNPNAGEVGQTLESQQQFEQRRKQSVASNSVNSVDSIMASLLNLVDDNKDPVCQDAYVIENSEAEPKNIGNVPLKPHSIFVCVAALDSVTNQQLIARTIFNKKPPGCDMNGDITVIIEDNSKNNDGTPLYSTSPTYKITYQYAIDVPIIFNIIMSRPQNLPNNAEDQIKTAVVKAFNGSDGSTRPRIGSEILASSFYAPIQNLGSWARIITLQIGRLVGDGSSVKMGINEMPTLSKDNIMVTFNG